MGGTQAFSIRDKLVIILSYSRVVFIASFILIAYESDPQWLFGFDADWFKTMNMVLFSLSNGYVSTQCATKAPSKANADSKEQVGTFVAIFLALGILIGSIISIGMKYMVPKEKI
jgi:hypothetical protein